MDIKNYRSKSSVKSVRANTQNKVKLVLGVMDMSTESENHEHRGFSGSPKSEIEKLVIQNEAE